MCLLAICLSSLVKYLFKYFVQFLKIELFVLKVLRIIYGFQTQILYQICFANILFTLVAYFLFLYLFLA